MRVQEQPKQPKQPKFTIRSATAGSWKPGASANPKGRPMGTRQALADSMIPDIVAKWREHGASVIDRLILEEPKAFAQIAASLLPREVAVSIEQRIPGNLDPESWATLRRVLDLIAEHGLAGTPPKIVFKTIENALRSEFARPVQAIEHEPAPIMPTLAIDAPATRAAKPGAPAAPIDQGMPLTMAAPPY